MKRNIPVFLILVAALAAVVLMNGCSSKKAPAGKAAQAAAQTAGKESVQNGPGQNDSSQTGPVQYDFKKDLFLISKPMGLSDDFITGFLDHNYIKPKHQSVERKKGRTQYNFVYQYYFNVWILLIKTEEIKSSKGTPASYSEVINAYADDSTYAIIKNNLIKSKFQFTKEKGFDKYVLNSVRIECKPRKSGNKFLDEQFKKTPMHLRVSAIPQPLPK